MTTGSFKAERGTFPQGEFEAYARGVSCPWGGDDLQLAFQAAQSLRRNRIPYSDSLPALASGVINGTTEQSFALSQGLLAWASSGAPLNLMAVNIAAQWATGHIGEGALDWAARQMGRGTLATSLVNASYLFRSEAADQKLERKRTRLHQLEAKWQTGHSSTLQVLEASLLRFRLRKTPNQEAEWINHPTDDVVEYMQFLTREYNGPARRTR